MNGEIELVSIDEALSIENAEMLISQYDLILDGTDNFDALNFQGSYCSCFKG